MFCGIFLEPEKLKGFKVISRIRTELAKKLDIRDAQAVLTKYRKPHMEQTNIVLEDATCYESDMRYPTTRSKYPGQKDKYFDYARKKKKPWKDTVKRTRSLLHLLDKLIYEQKEMFETGTHSVPNKIVSIAKSYVRPIVRWKEVKKVEFGAKANMIQVDGINFIEHPSFDAFNEGIMLQDSIWYSRSLFGKITHISADDIYATNANRKWCTER